jgi:hypothetical protein
MPHTNRKKKSSAANAQTKSKPTIVHTKRQEVQDDDGWTHIVDTPRKRGYTITNATKALHAGDFEINGVGYINRTLEEMRADFEYWKKQWEQGEACAMLNEKLDQREKVEEPEEKLQEGEPEEGEEKKIEDGKEQEVQAIAEDKQKRTDRMKVDNVVVLGLGSLQSARREGRRASATQLAALQTLTKTLGEEKELKVILQEPQFTALDKEFLKSLGYEVVEDPAAFSQITESSLVYAIHCYAQVYKAVSKGSRPAVLIGTDVENFGRFNL